MSRSHRDLSPLLISCLALLSFGRIWFIHDGIWDDNTWLFSVYATRSLQEFLATGFIEMGREPLGIFFYYFLTLHKTTTHFFTVFHAIILSTQILCPIMLYYLAKNLFHDQPSLALFIAFCLIAFPLDHTLPYVSAINYRLSLTLSVASLLLTQRALADGGTRLLFLLSALLAAGIAEYVFLEPIIAFEPARLLIIWLVLSRSQRVDTPPLTVILRYWIPFMLLALPLVYHKLTFQPHGLYENIYPSDPWFFLRVKDIIDSLRAIRVFEHQELARAIALDNTWAFALGLFAAVLSLVALRRMSFLPSSGHPTPRSHGARSLPSIFFTEALSSWKILLLGVLLFIPPALLVQYTRLPFVGEQHNTHASLIQIGTAIIEGCVLHSLYRIASHAQRATPVAVTLAVMLGLGVFFNNKYVDLYTHSWQQQSRFLSTFVQRFPSVPEHAAFLFDVRQDAYFSDLRNPIDFELPLNLLYATSAEPTKFHHIHAFTADEYRTLFQQVGEDTSLGPGSIKHQTRWGTEVLDAASIIGVRYRNGELLVNREIVRDHPDVDYKQWVNREFPTLPPQGRYVLRDKLEGLDLKEPAGDPQH